MQGRPIALPAGVDASAYRIIQEGLTNALKHAGCVPTEVTLSYQPDELTLEILDAGSGPHALDHEPGHGLIGMRERVALHGGDLHAGGTPAGGYAVRARLPLEGDGA